MELTEKDLFKGRVLGEGNYGIVYKAYNANENYPNVLAVKVLKYKELENDSDEELLILQAINFLYIVKFYTFFTNNERILHVYEYLSGGNLYSKIKKKKIFEEDADRYITCIGMALSYLHKKSIMHRDLKPENVMLDENDNAKLIDFGYACFFKKGKKYKEVLGTVYYLAPEILQNHLYDYRIDIWMLGVLYYEIIVGKPPFQGETFSDIYYSIRCKEPNYPKYLSYSVIYKISNILVKDPDVRSSLSAILKN